jgi:hypothetical protein
MCLLQCTQRSQQPQAATAVAAADEADAFMNEDSDNDTAAYHSTLQLLSPDTATRQLPVVAVTTATPTTTAATAAAVMAATAVAAAEVHDSTTDPSDKHDPVVLSGAADGSRRRGSYEYDPAKTPEKSILVVNAGSGSNGEKRNTQQSNSGSSSKRSSPKQRHAHSSSNSASNSSRKVRKNISWGGVEELDVDDNDDAAAGVQCEPVECMQVSL